MSPDQERWAEALAIERLHGDLAAAWVSHRIALLALAGNTAGVERFTAIAGCFEELLRGRGATKRRTNR